MRTFRVLLSAAALAAVVVPTAASADGRCKPYFYEDSIAGVEYTGVGIVC